MRGLLIAPSLLLCLAAGLPACSPTVHGVQVSNQTDRIVRVELMLLKKDGEVTVYSTQSLSPGGEFKNKVDEEERRSGMRVRFTLADAQPDDPNRVMLNLPDNRDRYYDLILVNQRLSAKDMTRERRTTKPTE